MAYATSDTLKDELLELASSKIDELCYGRIQGIGFNNLTPYQQKQIEKATLAQAQFYEDYGTEPEQLQSVSVGSFSIGIGNSGYVGVSKATITYLKTTGLMCRGL